jgi:hypothetical protein
MAAAIGRTARRLREVDTGVVMRPEIDEILRRFKVI